MSKSNVEDLIESAKNKGNPRYLRRGYLIQARSIMDELNQDLEKLKKELRI